MSSSADFTVVWNKEDLRAIERIAKAEPQAVYRGWIAMTTHTANKLRKVIRTGGGRDGVDAFPPKDTTIFRPRENWGGRLGGNALKNTIAYRARGTVSVVGFSPDSKQASAFGESFQTFLGRAWSPRERYFIHKFLGKRTIVVNDKIRQPRPVIAGFADHLRAWFPVETRKTIEKRYAQILKKRASK